MKPNTSLSSALLLFTSLGHSSYIGRRQADPSAASASAIEASLVASAIAAQKTTDSAQDASGISAGNVVLGNADPCGPPTQGTGGAPGSKSTCHEAVDVKDLTQQTSYGVQCLKAPVLLGERLRQDQCIAAALAVCQLISNNQTVNQIGLAGQTTNQWVWDGVQNDAEKTDPNTSCSFGYWLPAGGAPPPSFERCMDQIIEPMNTACQGPNYNAATVNIKQLPSYENGVYTTGEAVDASYPSYIMLPHSSYPFYNLNLNTIFAGSAPQSRPGTGVSVGGPGAKGYNSTRAADQPTAQQVAGSSSATDSQQGEGNSQTAGQENGQQDQQSGTWQSSIDPSHTCPDPRDGPESPECHAG